MFRLYVKSISGNPGWVSRDALENFGKEALI
jgi:hypothetical protein